MERRDLRVRFLEQFEKSVPLTTGPEADCWNWRGTIDGKGYGHIGKGGRHGGFVRAHRLSWELHNGKIPEGMHVLHRCDNKKCVRPSHLFLGTHKDNMADRSAKKRQPRGERHGHAKLNGTKVLYIIGQVSKGISQAKMARKFGVSTALVCKIMKRKAWKHLSATV